MGNHGVHGHWANRCAETRSTGSITFERAAETYIRALQTGQKLRVLSDEIAEKTAQELEDYPSQAEAHMREMKAILDAEGSDYAS